MEKINTEQINKLLDYIRKYKIMHEWIYKMCCVKCITEITTAQYNSLIIMIETIAKNSRKELNITVF